MEMFGQYETRDSKDKVYICNFSPQILTLSSMRRPKKIVMIGSDEREYPWLVKVKIDVNNRIFTEFIRLEKTYDSISEFSSCLE
jgi:hypothetical protein